jgi:hypothetical protein
MCGECKGPMPGLPASGANPAGDATAGRQLPDRASPAASSIVAAWISTIASTSVQ